jgi:hypothetical protein
MAAYNPKMAKLYGAEADVAASANMLLQLLMPGR